MGRMSKATELGLVLTIDGRPGHFRAVLTDDKGQQVWTKSGYKSRESASNGALYWMRHDYEANMHEAEPVLVAIEDEAFAVNVDDSGAPSSERVDEVEPPNGGMAAVYARELRAAADTLDAQAANHYTEAEQLSNEAKQLRAMADAAD